MPKFRKKSDEIEAVRNTQDLSLADLYAFLGSLNGLLVDGRTLLLRTFGGDMRVDEGDWIIKGAKGEFYPCKAGVFEATYEPTEEAKNGQA